MGRRRTRLTRRTSESTCFPSNPHLLSHRIVEGLKQGSIRENGNKDLWIEVQKLGLSRSFDELDGSDALRRLVAIPAH